MKQKREVGEYKQGKTNIHWWYNLRTEWHLLFCYRLQWIVKFCTSSCGKEPNISQYYRFLYMVEIYPFFSLKSNMYYDDTLYYFDSWFWTLSLIFIRAVQSYVWNLGMLMKYLHYFQTLWRSTEAEEIWWI